MLCRCGKDVRNRAMGGKSTSSGCRKQAGTGSRKDEREEATKKRRICTARLKAALHNQRCNSAQERY
eukprot:1878526-Rhodomonas_salina.2